ncbi:MAG: tetratricopeptide repeat protein [Calditrichaeota bacterium]|nr:tetratricopeptide repeat protein [Calditrichota bacterium]
MFLTDHLAYLSGWIPFGLGIIPLVGGAFTFIWWTVWKGTGFYTVRRFRLVLLIGWASVVTLYTALWSLKPPPPVPIRVHTILYDPTYYTTGAWRTQLVSETIQNRLVASPDPINVRIGNFTPGSWFVPPDPHALDRLLLDLRVNYIVRVGLKDTAGVVTVHILRRSGETYREVAEFDTPPVEGPRAAVWAAREVAVRIGDRSNPNPWPGMPPNLPGIAFQRYYTALASLTRETTQAPLDSLRQLAADYPKWAAPRIAFASHLLQSNPGLYPDEIDSLLTEALHVEPDRAEGLLQYGRFNLEFRRWDEAESALKLAFHYGPDDPRVYLYLARLSEARLADLRLKSRIDLLERAIVLDPGYEAARLLLASEWKRRGRRPIAHKVLEDGLAINQKSPTLLLSKSSLEIEMTRFPAAIATCDSLLTYSPRHPKALYNRGLALIGVKRYDEAVGSFKESLEAGGTPENYYYLGVVHQKTGRYEEAIKWYQRRFAALKSSDDQGAKSARARIEMLRAWLADTTRSRPTLNVDHEVEAAADD